MKASTEKRAVILIGHGSRAAGADDDMERIAEWLRRTTGLTIEVCRMEGRGVPFAQLFERCVIQGAKTIIAVPYFLHYGVHLRQDIPEILRKAVARHPEIRLVLGKHLGFDETLAALVARRLEDSEGLADIREMPDVPIDRRPEPL